MDVKPFEFKMDAIFKSFGILHLTYRFSIILATPMLISQA